MGKPDVDRRAFLGMAGAGVGTMLAAPNTALAALPGESDRQAKKRLKAERKARAKLPPAGAE